jgi:multiple sugar transport system permease protein
MTAARLRSAVPTYLLLVLGAVLTLAPFALSIMTALKSPRQFASRPVLSPPDPPTVANFTELFGGRYDFVSPIVVTAQVVAVILVGQLLFSVFAAYAFARLHFPGRDALFWVYLATLMVPQAVTIIPLYALFADLGMRNTFWALVLPQVFGSPYAIFLLREYFRTIPGDLLDAAKLDGAGTLRTLRHVVVPISRPILAALEHLPVAAGDHHRPAVAGVDGGHGRPPVAVQRKLDDRHGRHHRRDPAAAGAVPGLPAPRHPLDHDHRLSMRRQQNQEWQP